MNKYWNTLYGNPGTGKSPRPEFLKNLRDVALPYPMRLAWNLNTTVTKVKFHYRAKPYLEAALADVWKHARLEVKKQRGVDHSSADYDRWSLDWLKERGLDILGGTYAHRKVRGGDSLSAHAYGIAIDIDPEHNPLGKVGRIAKQSPWFVEIFEKRSFAWGGRWRRKDGMHFELDQSRIFTTRQP